MNKLRQELNWLRSSLPAAALPFVANLSEQFKVYERHPKLRPGLKPLMAWQWEKIKMHSSAIRGEL